MPNITCERVSQLKVNNKLAAWASYNNESVCAANNSAAIAPYLNVPGLPPLSQPIAVQNARLASTGELIGNGNALIMPPNVCFAFLWSFVGQLGFGIKVTLLPANIVMKDHHWYWISNALSSPGWINGRLPTWQNGNTIKVGDSQFALAGSNLTPAQSHYISNSHQIKLEAWPLISYEAPKGTLHSIPRGGRTANINTHPGTISQGQKSSTQYSTAYNIRDDKSQKSSLIFNILVMNSKYYNNSNLEIR